MQPSKPLMQVRSEPKMTRSIYKCTKCHKYTLETDKCTTCGSTVYSPHPARFSLEKEAKLSKYRLMMIKQELKTG